MAVKCGELIVDKGNVSDVITACNETDQLVTSQTGKSYQCQYSGVSTLALLPIPLSRSHPI